MAMGKEARGGTLEAKGDADLIKATHSFSPLTSFCIGMQCFSIRYRSSVGLLGGRRIRKTPGVYVKHTDESREILLSISDLFLPVWAQI